MTTFAPVPGIFPYPLRIVVSPFVAYDATAGTTTIILCDSNELGILAVNEEAVTEEWRDPLRDINSVKIRERYAVQILNEGKAVRLAKGIYLKRGWNVNEGVLDTNFALGIEFDDGPSQGIQGTVNADTFDHDDDYTKVDIFLQVSPTRRTN